MDVVERGARVLERRAAIDTAATAVSHRGELERSLVLCGEQSPQAAKEISGGAGGAGEGDAMTVSSGQSHLAGKDDTPRREKLPRAGCRASWSASHRRSQHVRRACRARIVALGPALPGSCAHRPPGASGERRCRCWPISALHVPIAQEAEPVLLRGESRRADQRDGARRSSLASLRFGRMATGSRNAAMIRAAFASSTVRSGICEPANGSGTSNPSPGQRGITCTWK